jgi:hypothetical protein
VKRNQFSAESLGPWSRDLWREGEPICRVVGFGISLEWEPVAGARPVTRRYPTGKSSLLKRVKFTFDMHCSIWGDYCMVPIRVSSFDQDKNQVRNSIRALFPERDCFTLVRPLNDEKELQKLDQIPVSWKHACL